MSQDAEAEARREADARVEKLMQEFQQHFREYAKADPRADDKQDRVFQSWAIQKIARGSRFPLTPGLRNTRRSAPWKRATGSG